MLRAFILLAVIAVVAVVIWWDRTEKSRIRQVFFSLYNKALANTKDKKKLHGVTVNILDVMDETDIGPTALHKILKEMENRRYVVVKSNTVKMTVEGVSYFKFRYVSEKMEQELDNEV